MQWTVRFFYNWDSAIYVKLFISCLVRLFLPFIIAYACIFGSVYKFLNDWQQVLYISFEYFINSIKYALSMNLPRFLLFKIESS